MEKKSPLVNVLNVLKSNASLPLLLLFLFSNSLFCKAQLDATVFEEFTQTLVNPYLLNPAASDTSYSFNFRFNNINELGLLKNVSRFYVDADKRFGSNERSGFHYVGLQITNSKLGDYINKSRMQMRYSWFTALSRQSALSAGVSLGFINYSFQTSQGGTGGTDYGPDGSLGIRYLMRSFSVGLALQQIFTPTLIPVNQSFFMDRLYNLDILKKFRISPALDLEAQLVCQLSENTDYEYALNLMGIYQDVGLLGVSNYSLRKTSVFGGLQSRLFNYYNFSLIATYSFYHTNISLSDNTLEIFISFSK